MAFRLCNERQCVGLLVHSLNDCATLGNILKNTRPISLFLRVPFTFGITIDSNNNNNNNNEILIIVLKN